MKTDKKNTERAKEVNNPASSKHFKTGRPDISPLPNNPAENAERTSPEEDKKKAKSK
jgi:hypothetical protein